MEIPTIKPKESFTERFGPLQVTLIYVLFGAIWILASDWIVQWLVADRAAWSITQTLKGLAYILLSAALVYRLAGHAVISTGRKLLTKQLRETENLLETVLSNLGEVVLQIDPQTHRILRCNSTVATMFGYATEELIGESTQLLHTDPESWRTFGGLSISALETHGVFRHQYRMRRKSGDIFDVEITAISASAESGWRNGVVCIIRDISERLAFEAQLRQVQKMEAIGTLAGGVAHEVNNPAMAITSYAQLIADVAGERPEIREYSAKIESETDRILSIVRNLLGFARADKSSSPKAAKLNGIVEGTLNLIDAVLRHDHIDLHVDIPRDLPEIQCYFQQVQQVVMNLLTNGRDALNAKYLGYHENKQMFLSARAVEKNGTQWVRVTTEDRGTGISEEVRHRMFEPFFTTKPEGKGTGLGLWIIYGIVKDHGGEIGIETEPGDYTRFHIDWPVASSV